MIIKENNNKVEQATHSSKKPDDNKSTQQLKQILEQLVISLNWKKARTITQCK